VFAADTAGLRKARGAFFTPPELCDYVTKWAIRSADDQVLEPSSGEAAFLLSAGRRLAELKESSGRLLNLGRLHGVERHGASAQAARAMISDAGIDVTVTEADFLTIVPEPIYDAAIGNPPYVRYQSFTGEDRSHAREAALRGGVALTHLASSWPAFVVQASQFLKAGGRLGMVLPAELLSVNYAAAVRSFLMRRFGRVRLVLFDERIFPGVLEEVVLLLAEGVGPTDHCELKQVRNVAGLPEVDKPGHRWTPVPADAKWTPALISTSALETFAGVTRGDGFTTLEAWGDTTLGMVTGRNSYFTVSAETVRRWGMTSSDLLAISPPGSRHLRGLTFTLKAWEEKRDGGAGVWLFRPKGEPSAGGQRYIEYGERQSVDDAYKCRVRTPWWRVPYLKTADLLLTYMNADTPRLCTNRASVHHLNSVHGLYVKDDLKELSADLLPIASLNSVTVLGAELNGRSYGGGMLKLEPREADDLPVPSPELIRQHAAKLHALQPLVGNALRSGKIGEAIRLVDRELLTRGVGLRRHKLGQLIEARTMMSARRTARGAAPRD